MLKNHSQLGDIENLQHGLTHKLNLKTMSWLKRIFGKKQDHKKEQKSSGGYYKVTPQSNNDNDLSSPTNLANPLNPISPFWGGYGDEDRSNSHSHHDDSSSYYSGSSDSSSYDSGSSCDSSSD